MNKELIYSISVCIWFGVFFTIAVLIADIITDKNKKIAEQQAQLNRILFLYEIQKIVGVEPDGIYGPETEAAWDRAVFNQYALKSFDPNFYEVDK